MAVVSTVVFSTILTILSTSWAIEVKFPPWFKFGASTAAYQVEGAWNISDKGESIWDSFTHGDPTVIADLSNGDVACDSYHQWQRDVDMAVELGLQFYRFSISWPRLLPTGYSNKISEDGKNYYNNLIDGLLAKNIECVVTIYHWDLPQKLQELGGWTNPLIVKWYSSYAHVVFKLFGDRVKTWITINEPSSFCDISYNTGVLAPGIMDATFAPFLCSKHALLAHASAYRIYHRLFKPMYQGKVSLSNQMLWLKPQAQRDFTRTKLTRDFVNGRYTHPVFSKEGGWPPSIIKILRDASFKEGYEVSRLPDLSNDEIEFIKGTYDFFGLNYYTCRVVRRAKPGEKTDHLFMESIPELRAVLDIEPGSSHALSDFMAVCPKGLRDQLAWIKEQYGNVEIFITENGYSTAGGLKDTKRSEFIQDHLEQVLLSIKLDRVNVTGYTYWSLVDNFEWSDGYDTKYGLYEVDYESEIRKRTPRTSAYFYSSIARNHALRFNSTNAMFFLKK